jgi:glycosyltransferase involved in cell wall biosynthesis
MLEAVVCLTTRGVEVIAILPASGPLASRLAQSGATVVEQPNAWWATPGHPSRVRMARPAAVAGGRNLLALVPMIRLLRSVRPDVVVTNTLTVPLGAVAAKIAGLPHVWYRHEFGRNDPTFRFHFGDGLTFASIDVLSTRVIVNSRTVLEDFSGKRLRSKARLVRHAVMIPDISTPAPGDHGGPLRLVQVGRLAPSKGHEDAVRAAGDLRRRGVEVALRFVGPLDLPSYTEKLLGLARKEGVQDRIAIEGFRPDPTGDVIWADVALTCSRLEAFGRTSAEAMKLGRPVIGSRVGATRELIRDGWSGYTYAPGDATELASKIELFARDRSLAAALGANAKSWAEETFTAERYASELMAVFQEALAERRFGGHDEAARPQAAG